MREMERLTRRGTGSESRVHLPQTALLPPAVGGWGAAAVGRGRRGRPLPPAPTPPTPSWRVGGIPWRRRRRREPARRLLAPQRPGGAAGWGRGAPLPSPFPRGRRLLPRPAAPVAWFWFHFPRPDLSLSLPSPSPLNSWLLLHFLVSALGSPPQGRSPGPPCWHRPPYYSVLFCFLQGTEQRQKLSSSFIHLPGSHPTQNKT